MTRLLWLDLETTGLNPERDLILEIGLVVTEGLDNILDSTSIVIDHGAIGADVTRTSPEALNLHLDNGLLQDIGIRGVKPAEVYVEVIQFLNEWWPEHDQDITVGGSGIDRFDLPFLRAAAEPLSYIPGCFYYGTLDTSGLKRIAKLAGHDIAGRGGATHRAVEDATDSFHLAQRFAAMLDNNTRAALLRLDLEPERDALREAIDKVRALHHEYPIYDECSHDDQEACGAWESSDGGIFLCGPVLYVQCAECRCWDCDGKTADYPCATVEVVARVERGTP